MARSKQGQSKGTPPQAAPSRKAAPRSKRNVAKRPRRYSTPAFKIEYNDQDFFVCVLPTSVAHSCAKVSRANEDRDGGYQRLLNETRARQIAEYLNGPHVIPGSLILASQGEAQMSYDEGTLSFDHVSGAFLVIDGQHRLYGAHLSEKDIPLVCCVLPDLTIEAQVQYFVDINGTQRGVPKTLRLEVEKFLKPEMSKEARRIRLFKRLDEDPASPLFGKMSPIQTVRGKISHVAFQKAVEPLLAEYPLNTDDDDVRYVILLNYLTAVEQVLNNSDKQGKLTNAAFFEAIFACFREACGRALARHRNLKSESFYEVLKPLTAIEWDAHSGTNRQAISDFATHMRELIEIQEGDGRELL